MSSAMLSMTGFGRSVVEENGVVLEVEIRSVNHRFLDLSVKVPRIYSQLEPELRRVVSERVNRGRVELFITRRASDSRSVNINFDRVLFQQLREVYQGVISDQSPGAELAIALDILSRREVLDVADRNDGAVEGESAVVMKGVTEAIGLMQEMRVAEGEVLRVDLESRLQKLREVHGRLQGEVTKTPVEYRERLTQRLQRLGPEIVVDASRLAAEVALMAERLDTTEELVRLSSHFDQVRQALSAGSGSGRRLDFLVQEMSREFNTITSKAQDATIQHLVIDAKAELERMKEQIQNVE